MKKATIFFHLLVLLFLLPLYASAAVRVGGWSPISNVKAPHVVEIGEFAVSEYVKRNKTELKFEKVVSGQTQVVAGMNYWLVVAANEGEGRPSKNYEAIVWERPWLKSKNLTSFKPASTAPPPRFL